MDYFWLIPVAVVGAFILWIFYSSIANSPNAGQRIDGKVLVDKPDDPPFEPAEPSRATLADYLHMKRTDDPD
jgi:hypothetical protein